MNTQKNEPLNKPFTRKQDINLIMNTLLQAEGRATIAELGNIDSGRPILLLHGGGGIGTVFGLSQALATKARVLMPTHPGFDGTPRPTHLSSVVELAGFYLKLLEELELNNVLLIGSSIGGWIAAEMASIAAVSDANRIGGLILLNAVGIDVPGHPITDVSALPRLEMIRLASHNPELVMANAPPPTPERIANLATNAAALAVYDNGTGMMALGLRERLAAVTAPALVLWGESDGIASVAYGQAYADAFADGKFARIAEAGHLPQIEQPSRTLQHIENFIRDLEMAAAAKHQVEAIKQ